ncbi:glycosyl transferase group 1 [Sulfolobus islandicus M.14.25]|uniref:Glycosyl transferase group 1 n=1 Tax=Saccharolobus islandicus (strain M.14.25 / Kamchatka \|nr:glycosyltransferase [Sulfolobus islandicus]ACP39240.1 glycosyl transferase group 1 [Sulfolobus islandicus M.14.25]
MKIFRIAAPSQAGTGGELRAYKVLQYLGKKAEIILVPPIEYLCRDYAKKNLDLLKKYNIKIPDLVFDYLSKCKFSRNPVSMMDIELKYYSNFIEEVKGSDIVFSDHESYLYMRVMSFFKNKSGIKTVLLNQAGNLVNLKSITWNLKVRGLNLTTLLKYIRNLYTFRVFRYYAKDLDLLLGVSWTSVEELKKLKIVKQDIPSKALNPSLALDLNHYPKQKVEKENYAVFFARLIPEKGIFDLIKIWKEVKKKLENTKLIICGKFYNKKIENKFLSMKSKDVIYAGFLPIEELYNTVAKAKVFIYPSHFDSFSFVMLESLAMRTPIVAYGLPAINEIYGNLNAVRLVKEFDIKNMAKEVTNIFQLKEEDYNSMFDKKYEEFISFYSSWERVAEEEYNTLKLFLNS